MPSHFHDPDSYHLKRLYDDKFTEAMLRIRAEWKTAFHAFCMSIVEKLTHLENTIHNNRDDKTHFPRNLRAVWLVFTSNLNGQTSWLKVKSGQKCCA